VFPRSIPVEEFYNNDCTLQNIDTSLSELIDRKRTKLLSSTTEQSVFHDALSQRLTFPCSLAQWVSKKLLFFSKSASRVNN
jgi:hypothetical protein